MERPPIQAPVKEGILLDREGRPILESSSAQKPSVSWLSRLALGVLVASVLVAALAGAAFLAIGVFVILILRVLGLWRGKPGRSFFYVVRR